MSIRTNFDHPVHRRSLFVIIRRHVVERVNVERALETQVPIEMPCRFIGAEHRLRGTVTKITLYRDGKLVMVKPYMLGFLSSWGLVPLWVPDYGQCGVLTVWKTQTETRRIAAHEMSNHQGGV